MVTGERKRVLLADDDPSLRRLVGTTLGSEDFELLHAADGDEALEVARREHPGVVLLDVNMPRRNGFEVCRLLKADPATADIRIVMLTARGNDADRQLGREAGADEYFVKPFSPVKLLDTVYALLEGRAPKAADR